MGKGSVSVRPGSQDLEQAATGLLVNSMGLREGEKCLIVSDPGREGLGAALYRAAREVSTEARLTILPISGLHGWDPQTLLALEREMLSSHVIVLLTGRSLSHTDARRKAVKLGARLASMPGITADMLLRAASADYHEVGKTSKGVKDILDAAETISVVTSLGTKVTFSVKGMAGHMEDGLYNRPGTWGNMPAGEASIGPLAGSAEGVIVVDWSMSSIGRLQEPLFIVIREGHAVDIQGRETGKLLKRLKPFGRPAFTLAEFGMGTNRWAQLSGIVLEDEKVMGTAHFALGNNISFGGSTDVPIHLDGVLLEPTVTVDGRPIMEQGRLLSFL